MDTFKDRHVQALLEPSTPEEHTIRNLFNEVSVLAERYKGDAVMMPVVLSIAQGLIRIVGDGEHGRIDPTLLNKQVRNVLAGAGVNTDDL